MSGLRLMGVTTGMGAAIGGLVGLGTGAPSAGATLGASIGTQIGVMCKGEEALDMATTKVEAILDGTGEKLSAAADKLGVDLSKISDVACKSIELIANVGTKLIITGYSMNLGITGSATTGETFRKFFPNGAFQDVNFAASAPSNLMLNAFILWSGIAIGHQIFKHVIRA
jgi:hypothetical protein